MPPNLVARTQLIDGQDLSSAESFSEQVNCSHLSTEHAVCICRLRRSQETLVKRLQQTAGRTVLVGGSKRKRGEKTQCKK